jgi:signal transduction histidine kinase/ligand-binding sensor domain-containing protein
MGRAHRHAILALAVLLACCRFVFALDPSLNINQYAHTAWRTSEGFSKGSITSIAQTPDGYLWLGTGVGLLRFDGVRNVPWQPPGDQRLPAGRIRHLLVTRDGTLWIGTDGGLGSLKNGQLTHYPELAGHIIFALLEDRDGTVWAGGTGISNGILCGIHNGSVHCYGGDGSFGQGVFALHEDGKGNLWARVADGLWKWKPGPPKFYSLPGEPPSTQALSEDADGTLLVGWNGGIYRFVDGKTEAYSPSGISRQFMSRTLRDRNGGLWIGTHESGLLHLHQGRTDVFSTSDGLSGEVILGILEDREGNIWVGTNGGLDRFRDSAAVTFNVKQGLSNAAVVTALADKDGSVWLATIDGLNRWDYGQIMIPPTGTAKRDGKLNGNNPTSLFQDDRGRIWVSTFREFGFLEDGRFTTIKGIPEGNKPSIAQDTAGDVWVIDSYVGLFQISPENEVREIRWADLGHKDDASVLAADRKQGGLWIGFSQGGIAYFSGGQVRATYTTTQGLGAGRVRDLQFGDDGAIWVSTERGLSHLKDNRIATMTSKNGLPCDAVQWAMEEDDRSMWLYMACGLVRIARSELDAWVPDPNRAIQATAFDSSDGVRSTLLIGVSHPQVARTPDGRLWFVTGDGVSVIDTLHLHRNELPPPVHIEQIIADRKTYDASSDTNGRLRLPPLIRDLEIDYTALSLAAPEKVRFRVQLEGWDRDWKDSGNERKAFYSNLPPRNYRFRVIACNNSGVWNEKGAFLNFSVAPAYYQTNWFRVSCVTAFLLVLWTLYQLRLRQLAHQFNLTLEAQVNERTRIARDLHDTLLQSFHGLLFRIQAARNMLPRRPEEAMETLDGVIGKAEQAITEGRDAIQNLRAEPVAEGDLEDLLTATGQELAGTQDANPHSAIFRVTVEGTEQTLAPILQDEIYWIAREVLRNAFQHASARHIEAEIRYDNRQFRLRVRDDGKGIDLKILNQGRRTGHWGLPGIRERAKQIGARLEFWSEAGAGTEVELTVPASVAYKASRNGHGFKLFHQARDHEHRS